MNGLGANNGSSISDKDRGLLGVPPIMNGICANKSNISDKGRLNFQQTRQVERDLGQPRQDDSFVAHGSSAVQGKTKEVEHDEDGPSVVPHSAERDLAMEEALPPKAEGHTLQDLKLMYEHEGDWDDDEDDDQDWDPDKTFEAPCYWFCTNCTAPNQEQEQVHCKLCLEHRNSGLLIQGHIAPLLLPKKVEDTASENEDKSAVILPPQLTSQTDPLSTAIGFDERMLLHFEAQRNHPHPERPDRLRAIMAGLNAAGLFTGRCCTIIGREATPAEMALVHSPLHIEAVEATAAMVASSFGSDTYTNRHSALAARIAAGISVDVVKAIFNGQVLNGFAFVRPPGHHARPSIAMGFCLHNNAAIAAKAALAAGAKKVLIVDWDVHHGNGTQEIFEHDSTVLYVSLHRYEGGCFYPGTGAATEVGVAEGEGFSVNIPWPCGGIGDGDYLFAFKHVVLPIAEQYAPDITIISAGFDAAQGDPLGGCQVTPSGYAHMTRLLYSVSKGKLLVVLEGGYNLRSISASAAAVLQVLVGESHHGDVPTDPRPTLAGIDGILQASHALIRYWTLDVTPIFKMRLQLAAAEVARREGRHRNRGMIGGPIWWKWGRKRFVYDLWSSSRALRSSSLSRTHPCKSLYNSL